MRRSIALPNTTEQAEYGSVRLNYRAPGYFGSGPDNFGLIQTESENRNGIARARLDASYRFGAVRLEKDSPCQCAVVLKAHKVAAQPGTRL